MGSGAQDGGLCAEAPGGHLPGAGVRGRRCLWERRPSAVGTLRPGPGDGAALWFGLPAALRHACEGGGAPRQGAPGFTQKPLPTGATCVTWLRALPGASGL